MRSWFAVYDETFDVPSHFRCVFVYCRTVICPLVSWSKRGSFFPRSYCSLSIGHFYRTEPFAETHHVGEPRYPVLHYITSCFNCANIYFWLLIIAKLSIEDPSGFNKHFNLPKSQRGEGLGRAYFHNNVERLLWLASTFGLLRRRKCSEGVSTLTVLLLSTLPHPPHAHWPQYLLISYWFVNFVILSLGKFTNSYSFEMHPVGNMPHKEQLNIKTLLE